MNIAQKHSVSGIVTILLVGGVVVALAMAGCGGGHRSPADGDASTSLAGPAGSGEVVLPAAASIGDMDGDGNPTTNDAQLIMNIVVDPSSYDVMQKHNADCDFNGKVEIGDAVKVLQAAAGTIVWPFGGEGPPPPPPI